MTKTRGIALMVFASLVGHLIEAIAPNFWLLHGFGSYCFGVAVGFVGTKWGAFR